MRLIYLTAKQYPGGTADHNYVRNLALAFYRKFGKRLTFVVCNTKKDALLDIPIVSISVPQFIKRTIVFFFWIPWYWFTELKKNKASVIFFSNDFNLLIILIIWKRLFNLPYKIVSDWHLLSNTWKDKFIAKWSDCSITTSQKLEYVISELAPHSCVRTIYGGVALENYKSPVSKIELRKKLGLPQEKILIGYVGLFTTMSLEKGISTMIDSLRELDDNYIMVFVGGKKDEIERYKKYANSKNVSNRCIFLPIQPFIQVIKYEQAMDMLVIPYPDKPHFRQYGFPMKVYEYMASGMPIIYTKLELSEEILADCAFGIVPDNSFELASMARYIHDNTALARAKADSALQKIKEYSWDAKALRILKIFDMISRNMLIIPDIAVKYILFQRTEYLIYQNTWWLNKIIIRIPFLTYNMMVLFEAWLFRKRLKRLFSKDMMQEYNTIKGSLPENPEAILDIGCGVAGIDGMLNYHYKEKKIDVKFYLLDRTELKHNIYYGFKDKPSFYNSLSIAESLLVNNGVKPENIYKQEATPDNEINFSVKFDMIISLISWGFHYPISIYLDKAYELLKPGGVLIIDARKNSGIEETLKNKFGNIKIVAERQKRVRIVAYKK